jgi:hypothetical protein
MSSIIPADQILKGSNAQRILELFGNSLSSSYISTYLEKYIPESNKARLSKYNSNSLETDLNDSNLKKEIERLQLTQEKADDLANLKKEYSKFSKDILIEERFEKIQPNPPYTIIGVGVDGSGSYPLNITQETNDIRKIEYEAQTQTKWNPLSDPGDEYLRESVKNVCLWQATNVGQFPIGSPVEVCSAVIQLLSPTKYTELVGTTGQVSPFPNDYTGKQILEKRKEISGLQYLIDGNLLDIDNKNITINGKKDFEKQNFVRFGMNGKNNAVNINLFQDRSTSIQFQCTNNTPSATLVSNELAIPLNLIHQQNPNIIPPNQRAAILFLFTIFFEYGCYIFNMYNEYLIKKIGKSSSVLLEFYKKANLSMLYNYILLINYALIRKFKIKNNSDEYYEPNDFIFVDEVDTIGTNLSYDRKIIFKTARRIFPNEIKKGKVNIRIYFKLELYTEWNVDIDEFTRDKFPIAFNTDMDLRNKTTSLPPAIQDVDYERTIGRLTSFLLQDNKGEIPKTGDAVITVGAPFQNEDVFKQTFEALDAYYDFIRNSKSIYKEYVELKIDIFRSSYTAKDIQKWYNLFMDRFKIAFTSYSNPERQKIEIIKVIDLVISEYKKIRADELRYMDTKVALKKNTFDSSNERYRGIMSMKYGLAAEMIIKIAELTYLIYQGKNPGTPSIFITELYSFKKKVDKENEEKTKKTLDAVKAALYRKLGKNMNQSLVLSNRTITLNNLPPTPPYFTSIFNTALSQLGISIQGISSQTPGVREAGKNILPPNLRIKVENIKFWQDLRKLFSGRTILIPVAITRNNKFNDNDFYLVDIFKSVIFNRLKIFKITKNGVINRKMIDSVILNNSYILMASNEIDLANPISWRCINYNNIAKLIQGEGSFKSIKRAMGAFFNLLANNAVLLNLMNVEIPPNSNITVGLIKYCNSIMKKELADCTILISRNQFAQTVQSQMGTLTGTSGIDLLNGLSYYQKKGVVAKRTENIVIR